MTTLAPSTAPDLQDASSSPLLDDEFHVSEDLVQSRQRQAAGSSDVAELNHLLPPDTPLRLHQDLKEGCGGQLWPAGMVLSKYLLTQRREAFKNCSILELGAGGGLVGLAVALGCNTTQPVHITDQLPMLALMNTNIHLNNLQDKVKATIYDWGSAVPEGLPRHPDILLAADCVYFEPAFPLLQRTMRDLIGDNTVCYFCFKKRRRADLTFIKTVKKSFDVQVVDDDPDQPVYSREKLYLYRITAKNSQLPQSA
ncbi:hypothetical protein K461DRAFT_295858 [Myriangium duriaei CBS 260.36]|uniref:Protein-lysine N-methyltransferase EFM6 n=1 Tax=Myriangium duriaei CBS 260.36 TaxID=1168546 RepID=A0A9P4IXE3_9PEZI|nr:hypothetical protein K461DRAFT_295858 [Myriangium duriaei CBS 260.36]